METNRKPDMTIIPLKLDGPKTANETTILVVDDSSFFRQMICDILGDLCGYCMKEAESGEEALAILNASPEVDLVISDMNMEGMSGLDLLKEIRARGLDMPIMILTANEKVTIAIDAIKAGANDYLIKDEYIQDAVPLAVEQVLERHHLQKRNAQLQAALEEKITELAQSNRDLLDLNAVKNRFLAMAAHDIRNPLTSIRGLSEILTSEAVGPLTEEQREFVTIIHKASDDMLHLVNDLLDVSIIESGKLKLELRRASLRDLLATRLRLNRVIAGKKDITIEAHMEEVPEISFDPDRISQVIDNLIGNAVKFSPPGTSVFVSLSLSPDAVVVTVRDEGPGLSEEDQKNLFNPFQRLSARPTGGETSTGLGLAIVKKIVEAHNGHIEVESTPGKGAAFRFSLPRHAGSEAEDVFARS